MPASILVRRAGPVDAEAVAAVLRLAFWPFRARYTPAAFAATTPPAAALARRFAEGPVWLAESDGGALGTVAAVPRGHDLYVRSMAVVPEARGRGVGASLLDAVEGFARQARHRRLILSTTPFLGDALRLYRRAGFRRDPAGPLDLHGTPLLSLVKDVGAQA